MLLTFFVYVSFIVAGQILVVTEKTPINRVSNYPCSVLNVGMGRCCLLPDFVKHHICKLEVLPQGSMKKGF